MKHDNESILLKTAKSQISINCKKNGLCFDEKGYVECPQFNLVDKFENWIVIKNELEDAQGGELKLNKFGRIKFNAIHSSAALCVNNFAPFKRYIDKFDFQGYSNFIDSKFEKKLSTGISTPNLDFYIESETTIIGVESKYTEYLKVKLPNKDGNLSKYLDRRELSYLPTGFNDLIKSYINVNRQLNLDVAQLIKHTIGLINRKHVLQNLNLNTSSKEINPVLVYIYWKPTNSSNFKVFNRHENEIKTFEKEIRKYITFIAITYQDFWQLYENNVIFKSHIENVRKRYDHEI